MVRRGFVLVFLLGAIFGIIFLLLIGVKFTLPDGKIVSKKCVVEKLQKTDRTNLFLKESKND